jgi:hypothetical protein
MPPSPTTTGESTAEAEATRRPDDSSERASFPGERARRAATQGAKAAGLTAGGLAAGVLLESQTQLSRKLPLSRRPTRMRAIRHAIAKRLR